MFLRLSFIASLALASLHAQEQTARLVKDANLTPATNTNPNINWVMSVGEGKRAVFPRETLAHGKELWTSDGTPKGTRLLKDISPGAEPSRLSSPVAFGLPDDGKVAFLHGSGLEMPNLWVTDGTKAGTLRVLESPGNDSLLTPVAGTTNGFFIEVWGEEEPRPDLYFSDGTAGGVVLLNPEVNGSPLFAEPYGYTMNGPWCYFTANDGELWRSDGTTAGTTKLSIPEMPSVYRLKVTDSHLIAHTAPEADVYEIWSYPLAGGEWTRLAPAAGKTWVNINAMVAAGEDVFFGVQYIGQPAELWATDGTAAGTRKIPLIHDGKESATTGSGLTAWNGAVYLTAQNPDQDMDLWRSDGTAAGTGRLALFEDASPYVVPYEISAASPFFHFHSLNPQGEWELWRTGGTAASTRRVRGAPGSYPYFAQGPLFAEGKGGTFAVADQATSEEALWRTRGNAAGAVRLTRPERTNASGITATHPKALPYEMVDGKLLAFVETGSGHELWRMNADGSRAHAVWRSPVPLEEGYGLIGFHGMTGHGALFSFFGTGGPRQLWVTDGTKRGTRLLADHGNETHDAYPSDFVRIGETWFYTVTNRVYGEQSSFWKTDGTPAGTTKIVAADGTAPSPVAGELLVVFQERVYFLGLVAEGKTGLWRSDGTAAGTVLLKDEWLGHYGEQAAHLSAAAGKLLFTVRTNSLDIPWQSDGTTAGTVRIVQHDTFGSWGMSPALDLNGVAIFQADDQWWRHNGNGTVQVTSVPGYHLNGWDDNTHVVAGGLLFYQGVAENDVELWVTDGTPGNERLVKDIAPGSEVSIPREMIAVGNQIYFNARDAEHGFELWRSDGTEAGTVLVADIDPGPADSYPTGLKVLGDKLYFTATRRDVGRELFVIDLAR
jgi:ELWxxDGT repeat protein